MSDEPCRNEIQHLHNVLSDLHKSYIEATDPIIKRLSVLYAIRQCRSVLVYGGKHSTLGKDMTLKDILPKD